MRPSYLAIAALGFVGCAGESVPLPEKFDTVFVTGTVCIPSDVNTTTQTELPVRFVYDLPSCVTMTPGTADVRLVLVGDDLVLLGSAELVKDADVDDTNGCTEDDLAAPAATHSHRITQDFHVAVPQHSEGYPVFGLIPITVPYYSVEDGQEVVDRLDAGDSPESVVLSAVNDPQYGRRVEVTFAGGEESVTDAEDISDGDCHDIVLLD